VCKANDRPGGITANARSEGGERCGRAGRTRHAVHEPDCAERATRDDRASFEWATAPDRAARLLAEQVAASEPAPDEARREGCPRCRGPMPARPGATSRADDRTEVCPTCGYEEAIRDAAGLRRVPPDEWPVGS